MKNKTLTRQRKIKIKQLLQNMRKQNERTMPTNTALIEAMHMVLEENELDYLLELGTDKYRRAELADFYNGSEEEFDSLLDSLLAKGFLRPWNKIAEEPLYSLNALLVGWYEAQVLYLDGKPGEDEFLRKSLVGEYQSFFKKYNVFPLRNIYNAFVKHSKSTPSQSVGRVNPDSLQKTKTVSVNRPVEHTNTQIVSAQSVNELIEEYGDKGDLVRLNKCMCRLTRQVQGRDCLFKMPVEASCITFGKDAHYWVEYGHGKVITKEEALEQIRSSRDQGAIHSVFHERDNADLEQVGICTCCWDCCGLFSGYNSGATGLGFRCTRIADISNLDACKGCGVCEKYCPTAAVSIVNKKIQIESWKCIGCGQCEYQCPVEGVLVMNEQERDVVLPMLKPSETRLKSP